MKILYILEAKWHDTIGRCRKNELIGVFENLEKLENVKRQIEKRQHDYTSVSFGINKEIQLFHA